MLPSPPRAESIINNQPEERNQGGYLPHDTRDHQVGPRVSQLYIVAGSTCKTSSYSLEHQRNEIAGDKDPSIVAGLDFASLLAEGEDDMLESQINACGDEGGRKNEAGDLNFESEG